MSTFERRLQSRMAGIFQRQARRFPTDTLLGRVQPVSEAGEDEWLIVIRQLFPYATAEIAAAIISQTTRAGRFTGNLTLAQIGYPQSFTMGDAVRARLAKDALGAATRIDETSAAKLRDILVRGLESRQGTDGIARMIREEMRGWPKWRAEMVARTEVAWAQESTRWEVLKRNGWSARVWLTAGDERVDAGGFSGPCVDNGNAGAWPIDMPFPSGHMFPPAHPNCLVGDVRVVVPGDVAEGFSFELPALIPVDRGNVGTLATPTMAKSARDTGGVRASTERDYVGDVVTIELANGYNLTGTPNHPIATPTGWVAISELDLGSDVLCSTDFERMPTGVHPHVENIPPTIEDVAKALPVAFAPMPTSPEDFHGDGAGSDVHVVRADRLLYDNRVAESGEHVLEDFMSPAHMVPSVFVGLGPADLFVPALNAPPSSLVRGAGQPLAFLFRGVGHPRVHGGASVSGRNSLFQENAPNYTSADSEGFCEGLLTLSPDIASSDVVRIVRKPFSGHVYNLETPSGWYIGNGIVTHNCRCSCSPAIGAGPRPGDPWTGNGGGDLEVPARVF